MSLMGGLVPNLRRALPADPRITPLGRPDAERSLRFMEIVRRRLRERRYSRRTEETYVHWIRRFIRFHDRRHPKDLDEGHVSAFLSSLVVSDGVSASTRS
jgi:hypothetical protein